MSLGAAAVVGWLLTGFGEVHERLLVPVAIATGGLLAVASLGEPHLGMPDGRRRPWGADWLVRSVWPVGGVLLSLVFSTSGSLLAVGLFVATAVATVGVLLAAVVAGVAPAAAASVTLALAGAGAFAAVAVSIVADASPLWQIANATLAWCTLVAAGWVSVRDERHAMPWSWPAAAGRPSLAAATPPVLAASALVTSLAAMVVCYFLAPHLRWLYAVIAGGWFVCLAVPPATCGGGGWIGRRLVTAAAGSPLLPGSTRRSGLLSVPILVTLGWPAVVAAALPAADGSWSPGPLLAVGLLAAGACLLVAAVATAGRVSGECARATVLAAAALAVAAAGLPNLPSLAAAARLAMPAGSDRSGRSVLSAGSDPARLPRCPSRLESQPGIPDSDWMSRSPGPRPDNRVGQSYGS